MTAKWVQSPIAEALGWALVHFVWQGALIAFVLASLLPWLAGAQARYGASCTALTVMAGAFAATFVRSIPAPAAVPLQPAAIVPFAADGSGSAIELAELGLLERLHAVFPWFISLWAIGALVVGLYRLGGWLALQRMRRAGVSAASPEWQERLVQLARRSGVDRPLVLLESVLAETPMVVGALKPVILFPAGLLSGLPASQVEAILLHELAHVRRFDYLINLLQTLVESVLFYHPAVWWLSKVIRSERENCCDDRVVELRGDVRAYAAALMTLEQMRCLGHEPAAAAAGGNLMNRIRRLLRAPDEPRCAAGPALSICLALGVFCALAVAQQGGPAGALAKSGSPSTPYGKWLTEDVAYIIAEEEQNAFERLETDPERDRFIEQFWERRDPTPASPENEFKQEHYRRIAYANSRFPASDTAGWQTDRGRIYIAYGPPDEIESHPSGGTIQRMRAGRREQAASANPFEIWRYRSIEGLGVDILLEFVDVDRSGDYRLTGDALVGGRAAQ